MILLKKLIFAPFFLIIFSLLLPQLNSLLQSYDFIFSLSITTFIQLVVVAALVSLSGFLFVLFATLAADWKLILPTAAVASSLALMFIPMPLGLILAVAIFISLLLVYVSLSNGLKSYLTFQPHALLSPTIRHLSTLLILSFCVIYFLSSNQLIAQKGFEIPDSLIETALKMTPMNTLQEQDSPEIQLPAISQDQIKLLKQNPDLLRQSGLDPKILDSLSNPSNDTQAPLELNQDLIKQTVKDQVQNFIKPYAGFIPAALALILFLTLQSLTSMINLLAYPLLWFTFFILEKTGFVKFEIEQRPVKKLVV